ATLSFARASAGDLSIAARNTGAIFFEKGADAGRAAFVLEGGATTRSGVAFLDGSSGGTAVFTTKAYGSVNFGPGSDAANATMINEASGTTYFGGGAKGDRATVVNRAGGNLDISGYKGEFVLGSLSGSGNVFL
ncbi:hypothetical protein HI113_45775, partial [Corallococcus exiguus]|uniref:hypothetical protein n=1 Tax=Corallococcus exiguus TaxID=83462 RepID=UPI0017C41B12